MKLFPLFRNIIEMLKYDFETHPELQEPEAVIERLNRIKIKLENAYAEIKKGLYPLEDGNLDDSGHDNGDKDTDGVWAVKQITLNCVDGDKDEV